MQQLNFTQMNGSEHFYRNPLFPHAVYTDGCEYVAEVLGAYWLIDDILLHSLTQTALKGVDFIVWVLTKMPNNQAVLRAEDGNNHIIWSTHIPFTDFDFDQVPDGALHSTGKKITFLYENNTLMLPEER